MGATSAALGRLIESRRSGLAGNDKDAGVPGAGSQSRVGDLLRSSSRNRRCTWATLSKNDSIS